MLKKEFYFLRHGKTDFNDSTIKVDHEDVSLNQIGINQAKFIQPFINTLPIQSVCCSPLKRAKETKEIACSQISLKHYEIPELGECTRIIWDDMTSLKNSKENTSFPHVENFLKRTLKGLSQVLSLNEPSLIISHGGVHWAICSLLQISNHNWYVENCIPVHFFLNAENCWTAKTLHF